MGYFRELPNLLYQSFAPNKNSSMDYIEVKNIFRRVKLRDDLQNIFTIFEKFEIPDEHRPEIVLITANIVNIRNDWPLDNRDVYNYALNKYGNELNSTRLYETLEIKNSQGNLILPKGKVVDSDFQITYWNVDNDGVGSYVTKTGTDVRTGISNYHYELNLNDKKRSIYLLKREYLQQFLNDFRDIMVYGRSSQFIDDNLIKTENTKITMPY